MYGRAMIQQAPQVARRLRNPTHRFQVRHAPYVIQPFFIAPVLPGETLKNLSLQSRALTQPITNPLIGWWIEYYIFYVKHRDLADSAIFQALMLDASAVLTSAADYRTAVATRDKYTYFQGTGMDWVQACLKTVIPAYFRDEGGAYNEFTIDSLPAAYLDGKDWTDSVVPAADETAADVTIPEQPADAGILASDVEAAMMQYTLLRMQGLTDATYEDWLRSYGVRTQSIVETRPELVRYIREWSYPSSHVQPNATTPSLSDVTSAVSWSIAERADKERFFKEPGFLIGFTCCRPKVYAKYQIRHAASLLTSAFTWLPAILTGQPDISRVAIADDANAIFSTNPATAVNADIKDLFLYGDQFLGGLDNADTGFNGFNNIGTGDKGPSQAGVDALFANGDATGGVRQDGIVRLQILGHQTDTSPRGSIMGSGAI